MLRVWRRNRPDQARQVEADLNSADREVGIARRCNAIAEEQAVREDWRGRFAEMLATNPRAGYELREALNAMANLRPYSRQVLHR